MVATHPGPVREQAGRSQFIYVTGCDGTGKTTQAELLLGWLKAKGLSIKHLWLRFPFFLSIPFMVFARLNGYSWYEQQDGFRQGYWDFRDSWLLRWVFPWVLLLDAALASIAKVYLPLWKGKTVVCERFVLDMLVDLAVAYGDPGFHSRLPGRLFLRLLPREASVIVLDLDIDSLRSRRADLKIDRHLPARLEAFRQLAKDRSLIVLSSSKPVQEVNRQIQELNGFARVHKKIRGYGKGKPNFLQPLMRFTIVAILSHWLVQGLLNMDRTERSFKLGLDAVLTLTITALFSLWWSWQVALPVAFLLAHTLNFLFNGQLFALLKNFGYVEHNYEEFISYVRGLSHRAMQEAGIRYIAVNGSLSRNAWSPTSDLDACIIRKQGEWSGLRACWFLLKERTRALIHRFPLDMYVVDDEDSLEDRRSSDEQPLLLARKEAFSRDERSAAAYENLASTPDAFQTLTGFSLDGFEELYTRVHLQWIELLTSNLGVKRREAAAAAEQRYKLVLKDRLLIFLIWSQLSLSYAAAGRLFGVHRSTAARYIKNILKLLRSLDPLSDRWKITSPDRKNTQQALQEYPQLAVIRAAGDQPKWWLIDQLARFMQKKTFRGWIDSMPRRLVDQLAQLMQKNTFQTWMDSISNMNLRIVNRPFGDGLSGVQALRALQKIDWHSLAEKVLPLGAFITAATWATIAGVSGNQGFQDSWLLEGLVLPLSLLVLAYVLNLVRSTDLRWDAVLTSVTMFLYYTLPTIKYASVYASSIDSGVHISMMRSLAETGFPDSNYYRYTPAMHMLIAAVSQLAGLKVELVSKLLPSLIGSTVPLGTFMMVKRTRLPLPLGKLIIFFSALCLSLFYMPNGTGYASFFFTPLFMLIIVWAGEMEKRATQNAFIFLILLLLVTLVIVHSVSSLLVPSIMAGTGIISISVARASARLNRRRQWLETLAKGFLLFGLIGLFLTMNYWLSLAQPLWLEFVERTREFISVLFREGRTSGVLVPKKTFSLSPLELLSVFSFYHARDAIISCLVLVAIPFGLWSFRTKQPQSRTLQLVNVLTASYISFSLVLIGAFLVQYSAFGYQRLLIYIVTISPILAGYGFWKITEGLSRRIGKLSPQLVWTIGLLLVYVICSIQIYPYQPGVPQVDVDGTGEKTPIYWHHRVNTEYQRRMIEYAYTSMPDDVNLYTDYTGYQQVAIFINTNAKNRFRYGKWEEPESSYVLLHEPGKAGGFAEQAEYRSQRAISRLRNLPGVGTVYDNNGSFILHVPQHLMHLYDLSGQP